MAERLSGIPTNVITGFLGAGKSTAILSLLANKPESERWAVLVNEFGEVGIDGGLLSSGGDATVFIREVAGGCMCCTAGLPMQMAMNMLLARARPDRLIIEPTGLGHPSEVLSVLTSDHYQELLDLNSTLTLVDARKISDQRYTSHATFNEQLEIADVIVASKSDLYGPEDFAQLNQYLKEKGWLAKRELVTTSQGDLSTEWLMRDSLRLKAAKSQDHDHDHEKVAPPTALNEGEDDQDLVFPPEGFIRLSNQGEGFASHGWLFKPSFVFDRDSLSTLISAVPAERIKALVRTNKGDLGYNMAGDKLEEIRVQPLDDSRIEVITLGEFSATDLEDQLLAAVIDQ